MDDTDDSFFDKNHHFADDRSRDDIVRLDDDLGQTQRSLHYKHINLTDTKVKDIIVTNAPNGSVNIVPQHSNWLIHNGKKAAPRRKVPNPDIPIEPDTAAKLKELDTARTKDTNQKQAP